MAPAGKPENGRTINTPEMEEVDGAVDDSGCSAASEKHKLLSATVGSSSGWAEEDHKAPPPASREENGGGGRRGGGEKRRRRLSSRLGGWPPMRFRTPRVRTSEVFFFPPLLRGNVTYPVDRLR